nr:MarR family transcriptional regulator [Rhizobium halophytocola]
MQLSHLDVIEAVRRAEEEEEGEATVGAVAQRLGLDPSRASRMVAQLVEAGLLRRDVSQADGRRAVVRLTDHSLDLVKQIRIAKRTLIRDAVSDWSETDVSRFSEMFEQFIGAITARAEEKAAEREAGAAPAPSTTA